MATSGSTNFLPVRDTIIKGALRLCRVIGFQETISAHMMTTAGEALNLIAKSWMADGLQLWLQKQATLHLAVGTQQYKLGPTGDRAAENAIKTEVKTAVSSGTTLDVDDTTGMTAADVLGLELDSGAMHWTTIASVVDSDTLQLDDAVPSAAAVDNHVYTYTSLISRPYKITEMFHRAPDDSDTPIILMSRNEYATLSLKSSQGQTTQAYYDPQLTNGQLNIWPTANTVRDRLIFWFHKEVDDFDVATDDPEFPTYALRALKFALAADLGPEYGLSRSEVIYLDSKATVLKDEMLGFDEEEGSLNFGVDTGHG